MDKKQLLEAVRVPLGLLWKAAKDPLRLLVLSVLPFALAYSEVLPYKSAAIITVVLKGLDKFLHEVGKTTGRKELITGLTRF